MGWPNTDKAAAGGEVLAVSHGSNAYDGPAGVVTIGNFDGVHLGHQALLDAARNLKRGPVVAYTFDPAPRDVLRPDTAPLRLQTLADRVERLHARGADHVVVEPFDRGFAAKSPADFAHGILRDRLRATAVVVGWDFRFGKGRSGDAAGLRNLLEQPVVQVDPLVSGSDPISSSRIRALIAAGEMSEASRLLGCPHEIVGVVEHGDARGRELGFPTANVCSRTPLCPAAGVYAVRVRSSVGEHRGVANLGMRPTFSGDRFKVEVHLFDFVGDLYGTELRVQFCARIREERAFAGIDALVAQIGADAAEARTLLS